MDTGKLNIAICEDEDAEYDALARLLDESAVPYEGERFADGPSLLQAFHPGRYDLLLMDIYLAEGMTGVEAVSSIRKTDAQVPIAFLTSSRDHALEGYRYHVDRYVLKPVKAEELREVLQMAVQRKKAAAFISLPIAGKEVSVPVAQICYMEQKAHDVYLHLTGGTMLKTRMKLSELSALVRTPPFLQCHKSFLVNLDHVRFLNRKMNMFEMTEGDNVYIRRDSVREAERLYQEYMFSLTRGQDAPEL